MFTFLNTTEEHALRCSNTEKWLRYQMRRLQHEWQTLRRPCTYKGCSKTYYRSVLPIIITTLKGRKVRVCDNNGDVLLNGKMDQANIASLMYSVIPC